MKIEQIIFNGGLTDTNGNLIPEKELMHLELKTIIIKHPVLNISEEIKKMAENNSPFIPKDTEYFEISKFNPTTQHIKKDSNGKKSFYSVYAVKFYYRLQKCF